MQLFYISIIDFNNSFMLYLGHQKKERNFMERTKAKQFREKIRTLERSLEMLTQSDCTNYCSIGLSQCHALIEIGRKEDISLKELASIILLDTSTTSRIVDSLVKKGWAKRTPSKSDRRKINISLTKDGLTLFHKIEYDMDHTFEKIFNKIESSEHDKVLDALDLILNALKK